MRAAAIFAAVFLLGCQPLPPAGDTAATTATVTTETYKLGPGDRVRITTFGEDELTGDFTLNGQGIISFPLLGDVPAAGREPGQLRADIERELGGRFVRNPRVTLDVILFRPVFILGEVAKPGEYPFTERMSVFALVAKAGGFTFRANRRQVFIRRENDVDERTYRLDGGTAISPGDTVRIGQRYF